MKTTIHYYNVIVEVTAAGKVNIYFDDSYLNSQNENGDVIFVPGESNALDAILGTGTTADKLRRLADHMEDAK